MKVVTCISNTSNPGYILLSESCKYYGLELITIQHDMGWDSHRLKDMYLHTYLKTLKPDEIVFFTDGYDTIFVAHEDEILRKYYSFEKPVVFSTEINCFPLVANEVRYGIGKTKFQYLNSGGYMGKASVLLDLHYQLNVLSLEIESKGNNAFGWSNQYLWTELYLNNNKEISLDYDCSIFQTFANRIDIFDKNITDFDEKILEEANRAVSDFSIHGNKLYNNVTKKFPTHLHFNGRIFKDIVRSGVLDDIILWNK